MELIHNTKYKFGFEKTYIWIFQKKKRTYFVFFCVFVKETVLFNIGFGFVVLKSIW